MNQTKHIILSIILLFGLSSCGTGPSVIETPIDNFPIAPILEKYEKPPIISKEGDVYRVTSQFIYNSVALKEYNDRIEKWKAANDVK